MDYDLCFSIAEKEKIETKKTLGERRDGYSEFESSL